MSTSNTTPGKYQPNPRVCDDPQKLRELYCDRGLTIETIAEEYADVGRSWVSQKLQEYGITNTGSSDNPNHGNRGTDPPTNKASSSIDWSDVQ